MNKYLSVKLKVVSLCLMVMVITLHANNLSTGKPDDHAGYSYFIQTFLSGGLAFTAVPLFFLISGYLFFLNLKGTVAEFITKIGKRGKTLLIPYLFWSLWGMLVFITLQSLPMTKAFINTSPILQFPAAELLNKLFLSPFSYQLWFVRDLMMLVVFSPVAWYLLKYLRIFAVLICFVPWVFSMDYIVFQAVSFFFFITGGYIALEKKDLTDIKLPARYALITVLWIAFAFLKTVLVYTQYPNLFLVAQVDKLTVLLGVLSVWSLYDLFLSRRDLSDSKIFPVFSYTFFLYAFHEPVLTILKKGLLFVIGKSEPATLIVYFTTILLSVAIGLSTAAIVSRLLPRFYALITGGR